MTSSRPIARVHSIGKTRHGRRTERPPRYGEDEAAARDWNSSTEASRRRIRARSSTTSSCKRRALSAVSS